MRLIVWGAGELGGRVARAWAADGGEVLAFTRTEARHGALRSAGAAPRLGDPSADLRGDDALLIALPGSQRLSDALSLLAARPAPARVVVTGSTGIYGGERSGVIDEGAPLGDGDRARAAAAVEAALGAWAGDRGVCLRLGGLHRPGRGPASALARRGAAPPGPPDRPLALIHYDDAASAALAALRHPAPARIYLAVSPPCPPRADFYRAACAALGLPAPAFTAPTGQPPARFDVSRLRRDLLPEPAWPDWRSALPAGAADPR